MRKILKALLLIGGTLVAANFGLKTYKRLNSSVKLSKSLPEFLNNVYGEKPIISTCRTLNSLNLKIGLSKELLDKHGDIDTTVREYIDDFYPELSKISIELNIHQKEEESAEPAEEAPEENDK